MSPTPNIKWSMWFSHHVKKHKRNEHLCESNIRKPKNGTMTWISGTDAADAGCKLKQNHKYGLTTVLRAILSHLCFSRRSVPAKSLCCHEFYQDLQYLPILNIWTCIISKCYMVWICCQGKYNTVLFSTEPTFCVHQKNCCLRQWISWSATLSSNIVPKWDSFSTVSSLHQHKWFWKIIPTQDSTDP